MRALVVDDSRTMRLIIMRALRKLGFEALQAEDGRIALDLIATGTAVDLILVDWNMPVMNGLEFIRSVRATDPSSGAKIMMVTTETELPRVAAALEAGADEYLIKPFDAESIADKLRLLGFDC